MGLQTCIKTANINAKTLQFLNAVNGACHSSKQQILFYLDHHTNDWDARGAITRQFSLFTWDIV
jgi:hypothetical protein